MNKSSSYFRKPKTSTSEWTALNEFPKCSRLPVKIAPNLSDHSPSANAHIEHTNTHTHTHTHHAIVSEAEHKVSAAAAAVMMDNMRDQRTLRHALMPYPHETFAHDYVHLRERETCTYTCCDCGFSSHVQTRRLSLYVHAQAHALTVHSGCLTLSLSRQLHFDSRCTHPDTLARCN